MKQPTSGELAAAIACLRERDPVLARVIDQVGPFTLEPEDDLFKSLVRSILAQQISTSAAHSIFKKLVALAGGESQLLSALVTLSPEELRSAGVSLQKTKYLRDLAEKAQAGIIQLEKISHLTNDEIILQLTQVNGIGVWTVQMLLIFSLGRLDVFPGADLGIRTAIKRLYRKRVLPTKPAQLRKFERLWQPYASVASWYCWRSLEFNPAPAFKRREHKR